MLRRRSECMLQSIGSPIAPTCFWVGLFEIDQWACCRAAEIACRSVGIAELCRKPDARTAGKG